MVKALKGLVHDLDPLLDPLDGARDGCRILLHGAPLLLIVTERPDTSASGQSLPKADRSPPIPRYPCWSSLDSSSSSEACCSASRCTMVTCSCCSSGPNSSSLAAARAAPFW